MLLLYLSAFHHDLTIFFVFLSGFQQYFVDAGAPFLVVVRFSLYINYVKERREKKKRKKKRLRKIDNPRRLTGWKVRVTKE